MLFIPPSPYFVLSPVTAAIMSVKNLELDNVDNKPYTDNIEVAAADLDAPKGAKAQPPSYVASLSPEERQKAEKALVRKIDIRLLPMLIIMYIMNYLDRNNIVSSEATLSRLWRYVEAGANSPFPLSRLLHDLLVLKRTWEWTRTRISTRPV